MKTIISCCLVFAVLLPNFCFSVPVTDSLIVSSTPVSNEPETTTVETKSEPHPPKLKSMHVISNIQNRYGRTVISSKYANPDNHSQETTFSINLPDSAFISHFVMEIKGKKYEAYVREKEQAKKEYEQAVAQGLGAAHVAVSARDSNKFTVSVNVEPLSKVVFNLTYEQLLARKNDNYEMIINLNPGQLVEDLKVEVNINETRKINNVEIPALRSGNKIADPTKVTKNDYAKLDIEDEYNVHVTFSPSKEEQEEMAKKLKEESENEVTKGISGQFVVSYDVERDPQGGEVLVNDGYFVHFFAPKDLKPIPKHVVFVLDVSGSMYGRKIAQLREAMKVILGELNPADFFNLVKFHSTIQVLDSNFKWTDIEYPDESQLPERFAATPDNIKNAQNVVNEMHDEGLTNIIDALTVGLRLTKKTISNAKVSNDEHKAQPIIVFLTDGQANVGESNSDRMIERVQKRNNENPKTSIFALSFGHDANKEFLKELALKNSGFSRTIYEAADASLQLHDFYKQISSPLLTDIQFKYSDQVKNATKQDFSILFKGSEIVVAGKLENPSSDIGTVEGLTVTGKNRFIPFILPLPEKKQDYGSLERLWAYLTIKQLLDKKYEQKTSDETKPEGELSDSEKEALKIALQYSFVTPVTSLVVVKPNQTENVPVDDKDHPHFDSSGAVPLFSIQPQNARFKPKHSYRGGGSYPQQHSLQFSRGGLPVAAFGVPGLPGSFANANAAAPPAQFNPTIYQDKFFPPVYSTTRTPSVYTTENPQKIEIVELPWLSPLLSNTGELKIDENSYFIDNSNQTAITSKTCQAMNYNGNCTLLKECTHIYPKLDSFETYKNNYFCSLNDNTFAGVCCPEQK